jgi:hypothetical protein
MIENLILILIAAAILGFIVLIWLRQSVAHELREVKTREALLKHDFEHRRDIVPYLLESARKEVGVTDAWTKLAEIRALFLSPQPQEKELEFEGTLLAFVQQTPCRSLHFLDAKKDIEDISTLIEKQKADRLEAISRYSERRKQFPYSLASAIFGL